MRIGLAQGVLGFVGSKDSESLIWLQLALSRAWLLLRVFVWVCTIRRKVKVAIAMFAVLPIAGRRELIFLCYFLTVRSPSADQVHDVITDARPRIEGHVHDV